VGRGLAVLLVWLVALGGCGGGGSKSAAEPRAPALTVPETTTTQAPAPLSTAPTQTTTTAPGPTGGASQPTSPQGGSQQPPPSGSPASRFERFCRENPGACGN